MTADLGWAAFRRGEWRDARARFEEALAAKEDPELYDGFATCCRFLGDLDESLEARERAFRLFRESGDVERAAIAAAWLGRDAAMPRGELAIARAWFTTARRLLDETDSLLARGTVAYFEGQFVLLGELDAPRGGELGAEARRLGRELGDLDIEMQGLSLEGLARVAQGDLDEGMALVEEAAAAVLADDLSGADVSGWICCHLIYACERATDTRRAAEWCRAMRGFCERWEMPGMFGMCRSHYGSVLVAEGRWDEAEIEFDEASKLFRSAAPGLNYESIVRMCELRYRQGRLDDVDRLASILVDLHLGWTVMPFLAGAAFHRGDLDAATSILDRHSGLVPEQDRLVRLTALEIAADVHAALGDAAAVEKVADDLEELSRGAPPGRLTVVTLVARGRALLTGGEPEQAAACLEQAVAQAGAAGVPFDLARALVALSDVLVVLGDVDAASRRLDAATAELERLGATAELEHASRRRDQLSSPRRDRNRADVTERERDVLRLAADGCTDAEIASRLGLSPHTVHRHVANLRAKLGAESKAALVARAVRDELI